MLEPVLNHQLVHNSAVEQFKERLKFAIYDGAALLSLDELQLATRKVVEDTLSFLGSASNGDKGQKN